MSLILASGSAARRKMLEAAGLTLDLAARAAVLVAAVQAQRTPNSEDTAAPLLEACSRMHAG